MFIFVDVGSEALTETVLKNLMSYRVETPSLNKPITSKDLFAACFTLVSCLDYSSVFKIEI